jgi:WhiB family redox-sensing transcriptional regulator
VTALAIAPADTRRARILAHLAGHPDLTESELRRVIGSGSCVGHLLQDMEAKAQVVSRGGRRPGQGGEVRLWRVAPAGTVPPPRESLPAEVVARRRERDRVTQAARRARLRPAVPLPSAPLLPSAACTAADPALFFPETGDAAAEARAVAICAACPVRAACYEMAEQNGERSGIWGGINFETRPPGAAATGSASRREEPDYGHA